MLRLHASRSARAGRAPVAATDDSAEVIPLGSASDLACAERQVVTVGGLELLVIFKRGRFTVIENRCPHLGARLDGARVGRYTLTCPMHSLRYSLAERAHDPGPRPRPAAVGRLTIFPARVVNGWLYAAVDRARLGEPEAS